MELGVDEQFNDDSLEMSVKSVIQIILDGPSTEKMILNEPTVIIVGLDSSELDRLVMVQGDDFHTAGDDLLWYDALMREKMDSLKIPVKYTVKDTVDIETLDNKTRIIKDTTFDLSTYFYFDGKTVKRKELLDLIEN